MEILFIAHVWQKASDNPQKAQKRASETVLAQSNKNPNPTIQAWYPIFSENFENITPPALPSGWTVIDGNNNELTWKTYPAGDCGNTSVNFPSKFACYDDDDAGQNDANSYEVLKTPLIYVPPGASAYRVKFDYSFDAYTAAPVETFYVNLKYKSGNNPWNTVRILNLPGTADSLNKTFVMDITNYITGNNDTIQLEFVYDDGGDWGWGAGIDNVSVEGDFTLQTDLAVIGTSVELTTGPSYYFYPPGTTFSYVGNVWVKLQNLGSNPVSNYNVYLKVNNTNYGPVSGPSLSANAIDSVQFTNVNFTSATNTLKAYHDLSGDQFSLNDTLNSTYNLPKYKSDTILNYPDNLTAQDAIGSPGNLGNSHEAVKYDSLKIWPFVESADSYYITKVFFYHCSTFNLSECPGGSTRVSLWRDDGNGKPSLSLEIIGKDTTLPSGANGAKIWFIKLPNPVKLEKSILPFYAGRSWNINNSFPFGVDNNSTCILNYSCWYRADNVAGGAWDQLTTYNLNYSWILGIVVQKKEAASTEEIILLDDAKILRYDNGKLLFNVQIDRDMKIQIYNTNGAIVKDIQVPKGTKFVNIGKLPSGAYIYVIGSKVGKIIVN